MTTPAFPPLSQRDHLPDALRALADAYPREGWEAHKNFDDLTRFWLDRHIGFRRLAGVLQDDAEGFVSGNTDPTTYGARPGRLMQMFLGGLNEHHTIEDDHFFPLLAACDARLVRGFELMESDHLELHEQITGMADSANTALTLIPSDMASARAVSDIVNRLARFQRFLDRHLGPVDNPRIAPALVEIASSVMNLTAAIV